MIKEYWSGLDNGENFAYLKNSEQLIDWSQLIEDTFTLAINSPFVKSTKSNTNSTNLAALFLKRCMTDYRAAILLIMKGYPYQSGSIVASLFENYKTSVCFSRSIDLAEKFINSNQSDIPWGAMKLSKMAASLEMFNTIDPPVKSEEFELSWKSSYLHYKHLCKMKHPTMQQVLDEASFATTPNGFGVIVLPDSRENMIGLKKYLLIQCLNYLQAASKCFLLSRDPIEDDTTFQEWASLFDRAFHALLNKTKELDSLNLPIKATLD